MPEAAIEEDRVAAADIAGERVDTAIEVVVSAAVDARYGTRTAYIHMHLRWWTASDFVAQEADVGVAKADFACLEDWRNWELKKPHWSGTEE